jgi:hypothetical protein
MGERARKRWSAEDAGRELERWRASGVTLGAYCQKRGILYERLRRWRTKLEGRVEAESLRPVKVIGLSESGEAGLIVELASGRRVHVMSDFDAEVLARLVAMLEQA